MLKFHYFYLPFYEIFQLTEFPMKEKTPQMGCKIIIFHSFYQNLLSFIRVKRKFQIFFNINEKVYLYESVKL